MGTDKSDLLQSLSLLIAFAEAIIFGAPTYTGGASAAFKAFEEATSNVVMAKGFGWKDKIAAGFTNSGARSGDKLATLMQIALFAAQHGMHWVNLGLPPANNSSTGSEADLNRTRLLAGRRRAVERRPRSRTRAARGGPRHGAPSRTARGRGDAAVRPGPRGLEHIPIRLKQSDRQEYAQAFECGAISYRPNDPFGRKTL